MQGPGASSAGRPGPAHVAGAAGGAAGGPGGSGGEGSGGVRLTHRGRTVLLTLLGMLVLFGVGFTVGRALTGGDIGGGGSPCVTVSAVPAYLPPGDVAVKVLNSGAPTGSAAKAGAALGAQGFQVVTVGNSSSSSAAQGALVRYGPTGQMAAETLRQSLAGDVVLEQAPELEGNTVELLLRPQFAGVLSPQEADANRARPVPSASGSCAPSV